MAGCHRASCPPRRHVIDTVGLNLPGITQHESYAQARAHKWRCPSHSSGDPGSTSCQAPVLPSILDSCHLPSEEYWLLQKHYGGDWGWGERADSKLFLHLFLVSMCVTKKKCLRIFNDFKGLLCRLILIWHTFKDMQNNHHLKRSYRVSSLPHKTFELLIRDCALFRVNFVVFQEVGGAGQPDSRNIGYLEIWGPCPSDKRTNVSWPS